MGKKIIAERWQRGDAVGGGGQATVYKATEIDNPTEIFALKYLKKQDDIERRKRMFNEVNNVKLLQNDHLISIIDTNCNLYESENVDLYYVTSYIGGCTLEKYCDENDIPFLEALSLFKEMLKVVSYCHKKKILHRDIKPENIMLRDNNLYDFVLIDFGLSFNSSEENCQETCTLSDQQLGNRFLLLPELVAGSKEQKRLYCSDITQICSVFFYVLTGIIPNTLVDGEGKKPHQRAQAFEILNKKISDSTVRNNVFVIFDKAFEYETANRFDDVSELLKIIETIDEPRVTDKGGSILDKGYSILC